MDIQVPTLKLSPAYPCGKLCQKVRQAWNQQKENVYIFINVINSVKKNKVLQEEKNGKLTYIARLERLSEEVTFEWRSDQIWWEEHSERG